MSVFESWGEREKEYIERERNAHRHEALADELCSAFLTTDPCDSARRRVSRLAFEGMCELHGYASEQGTCATAGPSRCRGVIHPAMPQQSIACLIYLDHGSLASPAWRIHPSQP